ncbi:hypothetical protein BGX33_010531 [Mortierella sp. NVP41]|nr:hypothetical protein BGX33_010531 [Mortierella sp. NVP41]
MASESSSSSTSQSSPSSSSSSFTQPSPLHSPSLNPTPATADNNVPVLIAGAGPTGLLAGILLAKMGVISRIIERDLVLSPLSKAIGIHARTIELLKLTDREMFQKFDEQSWRSMSMRFFFGGSLTADITPQPTRESEFQVPWMLEQTRTIEILTEEYESTGMGRIDRGWELMDTKVVEGDGSAETKSWVETTIRRAIEGTNKRQGESVVLGTVEVAEEDKEKQYETKVVRSEYLIAADGGRSAVRHILKIPFPGRTRDYNLILFDGHIETDISTSHISFINGNNQHHVGMFPIRENRVRMMLDDGTLTQEQFNAREPKTPSKEYFEKLLKETMDPIPLKVLDYNWLTYYRVNERRATEFAHKGRIFLAGDAAHCHSPAAGQGLNLGLQDSYNLAWKMAMVLNGTAPQSLLDSYNEERPAIADEIIALSAKTLDNGLNQGYFSSKMKRVALTIIPYIARYLPYGSRRQPINMLGLRYYENSVNKTHKSQGYPTTGPGSIGQRAPDDTLVALTVPTKHNDEEGPESLADLESDPSDQPKPAMRLYEIMAFPGVFQILVFTADRLQHDKDFDAALSKDIEHYQTSWVSRWPGLGNLNDMSTTSKKRSTPQFMVHIISSKDLSGSDNLSAMANRTAGYGKIYVDSEGGNLHERYGFAPVVSSTRWGGSAGRGGGGGIVVVRPDSHISFRVSSVDSGAWADVDEYFGSILTR